MFLTALLLDHQAPVDIREICVYSISGHAPKKQKCLLELKLSRCIPNGSFKAPFTGMPAFETHRQLCSFFIN